MSQQGTPARPTRYVLHVFRQNAVLTLIRNHLSDVDKKEVFYDHASNANTQKWFMPVRLFQPR
jgi:hypothetical protein